MKSRIILASIGTILMVALTILALSSCATEPQIVYKEVPAPYPVIEHCKVTLPAKPDLPIRSLKPNSPSDETFGAYIDTVIVLKQAVTLRDNLLSICKEGSATASR